MKGGADFLVEIGTEEMPPKALKNLMQAFGDALAAGLVEANLGHDGVSAYASPRRLAALASNVPLAQRDQAKRMKGPPLSIAIDDEGKPTNAGLAFANKCGVEFADLGREKNDKGEWLSYESVDKGQPAAKLLPDIVSDALDALPIPRRMRWGNRESEFVRPVHWVLMLHGRKTVDGTVLGIPCGNVTRGHRFLAPGEIRIPEPGKYLDLLQRKGKVIADFHARREKIAGDVAEAANSLNGTAMTDTDLVDEVTALTEWPVAMAGKFDKTFLMLPKEVIVATLTSHQRYFPVVDGNGDLKPAFIVVANLESRQPDVVRDGNERVIRPRLADARFFWKTDVASPLGSRADALKNVVYQKGLGSMHDKCIRVAALATLIAAELDMESKTVTRAAVLSKCDLLTGMVGEFPELQGVMGRYYAEASGEDEGVAVAIGEQYLPRFAGDYLPTSAAGQVLAAADKLDTLAGIFVLGKKPTGNRDPFGLRRAALGVIRILIDKRLDIDFEEVVKAAILQQPPGSADVEAVRDELYEFVVDRLLRYYLDQEIGISKEMFEAVRAKRPASLTDFDERLKAVAAFSRLEPAASLAAANKRTANILRQAEQPDTGELDAGLLSDKAERELYDALKNAEQKVAPLLEERAYKEALTELANLRQAVDDFFDDVMVMTDDEAIRNNRLALLAALRGLFLNIADISRLTPGSAGQD
ncbi:MAG: glycine--tRNA ligase subunit beta [Woeseiaceae bacterium]|nr:glycine--tRNA ligase subunit beta [Woeseiaceae bacterium]